MTLWQLCAALGASVIAGSAIYFAVKAYRIWRFERSFRRALSEIPSRSVPAPNLPSNVRPFTRKGAA